jgi:hypothetical protein
VLRAAATAARRTHQEPHMHHVAQILAIITAAISTAALPAAAPAGLAAAGPAPACHATARTPCF